VSYAYVHVITIIYAFFVSRLEQLVV